MPFTT